MGADGGGEPGSGSLSLLGPMDVLVHSFQNHRRVRSRRFASMVERLGQQSAANGGRDSVPHDITQQNDQPAIGGRFHSEKVSGQIAAGTPESMHHQVSGFHREFGQEILLKTRGGFELTAQFIGFLQGRELRAGVGLVLAELANFVFLFQHCFQADLELLGRSEVRVGVDQGHTSSLLTNLLGGECQLILWPKQHHRVATNQIVRGSYRDPFDLSKRGRPASLQLAGPALSLGLKGLLGGKDHRPRGLGWRGGRIGRHPLEFGLFGHRLQGFGVKFHPVPDGKSDGIDCSGGKFQHKACWISRSGCPGLEPNFVGRL